ncbi:MAG: beta-ketoacyl-ACP synthase II [Oscillospiraceae bacterium]
MNRVVITGMGSVTALGKDTTALWESVKAGKHGFSPITYFDTTNFDVKYAASVPDWDPVEMGIPKKDARRLDPFCQFALAAANTAIADAGNFKEGLDPYRIGVIVGSGVGGLQTIEAEHGKFMEKGSDRISVFFVPMMITNMAGGTIAINHGLKGENFCPVSACSSSNNAIGEAFRKIKFGFLDAAVCGGAEAAITELSLGGFNNMGALTKGTNPDRLSIPFDKERDGFAMGEGAGILILENLEHAKARGAKIYGEVIGYGATDDAYHITAIDPEGCGPATAMEMAVQEGGIAMTDVGYINAHGTSTPINDKCETEAIKVAFGEHAGKLAISSTKSMTGHLLGAAGAVEGIITVMALREGILPPTAGYKVPDPECDLDYITEGARKADVKYALSNSFGFGGHNVSVLYKKYED